MSSGTGSSASMAENEADPEAGSEVTQLAGDRKSTDSNYPSFSKVIRSPATHYFRLEIPATFVKEHAHKFQATINLQGPAGNTEQPLRLRLQSLGQDRVHFHGVEWRDFVLKNGFQVGEELLFALVSDSTFTVRPFTYPDTTPQPSPQNASKTAPKASPQTASEAASVAAKLAKIIPESGSCSNGCRAPDFVPERSCGNPSGNIHGKYDIVYACRSVRFKREVEMLVESCLEKKLQCPHFVTVMAKSHLRDNRSSALSVPVVFLKKYGRYFAEVHRFQGPSERVVEVSFSPGEKFARFTAGWTAFRRENGFKLGDVLLFSLHAPSKWFVQVVLEH